MEGGGGEEREEHRGFPGDGGELYGLIKPRRARAQDGYVPPPPRVRAVSSPPPFPSPLLAPSLRRENAFLLAPRRLRERETRSRVPRRATAAVVRFSRRRGNKTGGRETAALVVEESAA